MSRKYPGNQKQFKKKGILAENAVRHINQTLRLCMEDCTFKRFSVKKHLKSFLGDVYCS